MYRYTHIIYKSFSLQDTSLSRPAGNTMMTKYILWHNTFATSTYLIYLIPSFTKNDDILII